MNDIAGLIEPMLTVALVLLVIICFTIGFFFITWLCYHAVRLVANKYVQIKSRTWIVRRWAAQEKEIARLKAIIEEQKND